MSEDEEEVKDFLKAHAEMEEKLEFGLGIATALRKHKVEPRRAWANILFHRIFMIGHSLRLLCDPEIY
jgi:hypothetical protein